MRKVFTYAGVGQFYGHAKLSRSKDAAYDLSTKTGQMRRPILQPSFP